jgi:hypothetical protein
MFQDYESAFCNNVLMILISMWRSPYVNLDFFQFRLLKPKYFIQNYFVQVLYIWAKGT